jgi:hypothetical protein
MATVVQEQAAAASRRGLRVGWILGGLSVTALVAVMVATIAFLAQGPTARPVAEHRVTPVYTQDELAVLRLVEQGVLPDEILDREPFRTKLLVSQGILPRETLESRPARVAPLYCPEERAVMAAVAAGVLPKEVLESDAFLIKRLINQGLIPRQSAPPC